MKSRNRQTGVLTVELALWLPVACLLVFGLLELATALTVKGRLVDATLAGLRWAAHSSAQARDSAGIEAAVRANLADIQNPVTVTVEYRCHCPSNTGDALIEVPCQTGVCTTNAPDPRPFTYVWLRAETPQVLSAWLGLPEALQLQSVQGLRID